MNVIKEKRVKLKTKRTFIKQGTCSRTFFHILNRKFGHPKLYEEQAIDPLAGGIVQQGYQCGMLWGASMGVGAESFRRNKNTGQATRVAITATRHIMQSFSDRTKTIECEGITKTNFSKKWDLAKYMLTGKFLSCFILAGKWAPEALKASEEGLLLEQPKSGSESLSCASEVVKKMGSSEEEMAMVAGFAGGLGLSGNGCGALAAAIWKSILEIIKSKKHKVTFPDPGSEKIINKFYKLTDYKMECYEICGRYFNTVEEHTEYIKNGGCEKIINGLANNSFE